MIDLSKVHNFYVACGYTDLRCGIDGLAAVVTQQFGGHLDEESLFLFCGRRTDRIKALYWSGDGYVLLYKRLSNGRFQWPRSEAELRLLDPQSFRWLMEGPKIIRRLLSEKKTLGATIKYELIYHRYNAMIKANIEVFCTIKMNLFSYAFAYLHAIQI